MKKTIFELKTFLILWITQTLSSLGSSMTGFALIIWLYNKSGSALTTALLSICSYAPYVIMSIFAGAISDKWNKKTIMLVCDSFAALSTLITIVLIKTDTLLVWHLYILNALGGLMNTIQQPASEVASTLIIPKKHYQKTSGMRSFSNSLVTILTPIFASSAVSFAGIEGVIIFDLLTFCAAFIVLLFFVKIPKAVLETNENESVLKSAAIGIGYLRKNKGILWLMLFLAAINFIASIYDAALPAMILSSKNGGETILGIVNTCAGIATCLGSMIVTLLPEPKNRVRIVCNCLLISMSTENFMLAFGKTPLIWCMGAVLGWICIPLMNANLDVILRTKIPTDLQGRVFSVRNTLQFFTIPLGHLIGGILIDNIFEPFAANVSKAGFLSYLFGTGKGSGTSMLFFVIGVVGIIVCLIFRRIKHIQNLK